MLRRQRFSQKFSSTHEAICRCDVSLQRVAATCRLKATMTQCRTENALFLGEHVIQIRESRRAVGVFVSSVLIPSSTNRRVDHFHPTRYVSHLPAGIFSRMPLRKIITQQNFLCL